MCHIKLAANAVVNLKTSFKWKISQCCYSVPYKLTANCHSESVKQLALIANDMVSKFISVKKKKKKMRKSCKLSFKGWHTFIIGNEVNTAVNYRGFLRWKCAFY